jgi:hypothetical protein
MGDVYMSEIDNEPLTEREKARKSLFEIVDHIENVQVAAKKLAEALIEQGQYDLARRLLKRAYSHDNSKFIGIEYRFLYESSDDPHMLSMAVNQHRAVNDHHPEFYGGGVHDMSEEAIAEMVVDWKARSSEGATSLRDWVKNSATKTFGFSMSSKVGKKINYFLKLLLNEPLTRIPKEN